jgi:hypothetical protein
LTHATLLPSDPEGIGKEGKEVAVIERELREASEALTQLGQLVSIDWAARSLTVYRHDDEIRLTKLGTLQWPDEFDELLQS